MDIKEYISSGILELYAAGALSESEALEVEAMAAKHPEVKAELDAVQDALNSYAGAFRKNPRPELRQRVLDRIDQINERENLLYMQNVRPDEHSAGGPSVYPSGGEKAYDRPKRWSYLMAAVWAFLVLNIMGNIFFYTRLKGTEEKMSSVMAENNKMKAEYEKVKLEMEKKSGDMKMVMNRQNKIVDMKGMEKAPQSFATVYWNPNTKQVMLNVESLPMPPADKQYQLWALKDGKPVDAGVFDMRPGAGGDMHMMPVAISEADAFAVTLEKKGGSPVPDLSQLYVMGKM